MIAGSVAANSAACVCIWQGESDPRGTAGYVDWQRGGGAREPCASTKHSHPSPEKRRHGGIRGRERHGSAERWVGVSSTNRATDGATPARARLRWTSLASHPPATAAVAAPPAARVAPRRCPPAPVCLARLFVPRPTEHYHDNGYSRCKSVNTHVHRPVCMLYEISWRPLSYTVITAVFRSIACRIIMHCSLPINYRRSYQIRTSHDPLSPNFYKQYDNEVCANICTFWSLFIREESTQLSALRGSAMWFFLPNSYVDIVTYMRSFCSILF